MSAITNLLGSRLGWSNTALMQHCWGLVELLPQVVPVRSLAAAAAAAGRSLLGQPQSRSSNPNLSCYHHLTWHVGYRQLHSTSSTSFTSSSTSGDPDSSRQGGSQPVQEQKQQQPDQQQVLQPALSSAALTSNLSMKQPAAAAGRHRQLVEREPSGFVTLPPQATASGYQESFLSTPSSTGGDSSSVDSVEDTAAAGRTWPIQQVQLPQEQLRISLRQEARPEEVQEEVDAYSLSRSLITDSRSFDTAAAVAGGEAQVQRGQTAQLTSEDRELLEKLVGIMTKDGKKSRARRILLDAMHIIKQQVAKGQHAA